MSIVPMQAAGPAWLRWVMAAVFALAGIGLVVWSAATHQPLGYLLGAFLILNAVVKLARRGS